VQFADTGVHLGETEPAAVLGIDAERLGDFRMVDHEHPLGLDARGIKQQIGQPVERGFFADGRLARELQQFQARIGIQRHDPSALQHGQPGEAIGLFRLGHRVDGNEREHHRQKDFFHAAP
jgi:hypothetical protein